MNPRNLLLADLNLCIKESQEHFNGPLEQFNFIKVRYLNFKMRMHELEEMHFDTLENYNNFIKQYQINKSEIEIEDRLKQGEVGGLLSSKILNYIIWLEMWLR